MKKYLFFLTNELIEIIIQSHLFGQKEKMWKTDIDKANVQWKNFTLKNQQVLDQNVTILSNSVFQYAMESQYLEMFSNERKEYLLNNRRNDDMQAI